MRLFVIPQRTAERRLVAPTPMIAPVIVCVVLNGDFQHFRNVESESTGCFGNYSFQWGYFGDFGSHCLYYFQPPDMVPSEMAVKHEKATQSGRSLMLLIPIPNPIE